MFIGREADRSGGTIHVSDVKRLLLDVTAGRVRRWEVFHDESLDVIRVSVSS